jgi:hypothetical protein
MHFKPSYDVDQYNEDEPKEIEYHFFGCSMYEWKTDVDYQQVYKWFQKQQHSFHMFFVPKHARADYTIEYGRPTGVDAHWLGAYQFKTKK